MARRWARRKLHHTDVAKIIVMENKSNVIVDNRQFLLVGEKKVARMVFRENRWLIEVAHPPGRKRQRNGEYEYVTPEEMIRLLSQYVVST